MKSREELGKMALIDLLYKANGQEKPFGNPYMACVVRNLSGKGRSCHRKSGCYNCIAAYLNEEQR